MYDLEVRISFLRDCSQLKPVLSSPFPQPLWYASPARELFIRLKIEVDFRSFRDGWQISLEGGWRCLGKVPELEGIA